jgi:hypothetical protein
VVRFHSGPPPEGNKTDKKTKKFSVQFICFSFYLFCFWGCSSVGRASVLQAEGRRFDPDQLHQEKSKWEPFVFGRGTGSTPVGFTKVVMLFDNCVFCKANYNEPRIPLSRNSWTIRAINHLLCESRLVDPNDRLKTVVVAIKRWLKPQGFLVKLLRAYGGCLGTRSR